MPTTTAIDPKASLRGQQITPDRVDTQVTPERAGFTPVSQIDPVAAQKISGMAGTGPVGYTPAQAQQASAGRRLGVNINPGSVMKNAMQAFQAQLPQMNIDFADQSDQLAKKTASMGRTGSGLFNRDTGYISDRSRAAREGMLGNLSFTAAQSDAANRLAAQTSAAQIREQQESRFANTNVANMQSGNQLSLGNAQNALKAAMGNQDVSARVGMADAANALKASLANQGTALDLGKFNAGTAADVGMFNARQDLTGQMENLQNQLRQNEFGSNFMANERGYQDRLAAQAQENLWKQMEAFRTGFQGDPTNTIMQAGQNIGNMSGEYGQNAAQTNAGMQQGVQGLLQMLMMGQGAAPQDPMQAAIQNIRQPQMVSSINRPYQPLDLGVERPRPRGVAMEGVGV